MVCRTSGLSTWGLLGAPPSGAQRLGPLSARGRRGFGWPWRLRLIGKPQCGPHAGILMRGSWPMRGGDAMRGAGRSARKPPINHATSLAYRSASSATARPSLEAHFIRSPWFQGRTLDGTQNSDYAKTCTKTKIFQISLILKKVILTCPCLKKLSLKK